MGTLSITLRHATAADIPEVGLLLEHTYRRVLKTCYPPSLQVTAIPLISRVNPALVAGGTYHLAEDQFGNLLGAGGWTHSAKTARSADMRHLAVHHDHLRQGIARRLVTGIVGEARSAGVERLDCLSTRMAEPFYVALGFRRLAEVTIGLRPGIDLPVIRMVRDL